MLTENNLNITTQDFDRVGSGTPNAVVKAPIGSRYTDLATGQQYIKTTNANSATGWGILGDLVLGAQSGTVFTLTGTTAAIAGGTTSAAIVLPYAGRWLLEAHILAENVAATYAASRTLTFKLRRTNNTAADITGATITAQTGVITTLTSQLFSGTIPPVVYDTSATDDAIALYGHVSTIASAGSSTVNFATVKATYIGTTL